MTQSAHDQTAPLERPIEPLRWIGTYKILKGVLALIGGILLLRLMHRSLPDVAQHWMHILRIEPHSALGHLILHRILLIKNRSIGWVAVALFAYIPVTCAEGIGLMLRKVWAEWLTLVTTCALIPLEIREVLLRTNWIRLSFLVGNILILIYLVIRLRRDRRRRLHAEALVASSRSLTQNTTDSSQNKGPRRPSPQSDVPE